ncbi:hypothetical protein [Nostoc sp. NMS4]|uniref:hypothetical protein n=1 Tax=Nostoc sp. NMS4 TaxID=2815390 RepID=UPI0025D59DBC|nr:hypothetical protein [Nostoc sp. NMS4]MBN3922104.1 hypothetical protein [Nostoc sp. NMS4]
MTQELIDLKKSILEGRYADALAIVDELTYTYSPKELPAIMDDYLSQLAGGEDWINREK